MLFILNACYWLGSPHSICYTLSYAINTQQVAQADAKDTPLSKALCAKGKFVHLNKTALLLDMNSTFMFGEDNFGSSEDFAEHYHRIGGKLPADDINEIIRYIYNYLDVRYPNPKYRECFPSIESVILNNSEYSFSAHELQNIIHTFAQHEIGSISPEYVNVLHKLSTKFKLAVVIDIWAPKITWLNLFEELGIGKLFIASSYSSDHGVVKPSPKPFNRVIAQLNVNKEQCLMIGDSVRRDFGGAEAAGIDCVLVGGANHINAAGCYKNLLEFSYELFNTKNNCM